VVNGVLLCESVGCANECFTLSLWFQGSVKHVVALILFPDSLRRC